MIRFAVTMLLWGQPPSAVPGANLRLLTLARKPFACKSATNAFSHARESGTWKNY
jgi:hypothetical protein